MKSPCLVFSILLLSCVPTLRADSVLLKSGETITGKILQENVDGIVIEYKVSSSITDQKSIPNADIAKIEKEQLDEVAYAAIQNFKPDPEWSLQADNYERLIRGLTDFVTRFPKSPHAPEVKQNLDALSAEKERVDKGEMKFFGNWLTKAQADKQHSQSQAQETFAVMREKAMQGDFVGALNIFDGMKTSCKTALIYPSAIQLAGTLLQNLQRQIALQKQALIKEDENWKHTIAMTAEPQKSQFIASRNQIAQRADAALAAAQKSGMKWTPIVPHSPKSLELLERAIVTEKSAISSLPVAKMRESITLTNKAADAVNSKDLPAAENFVREAQTLWPDNSALEFVKSEIVLAKPTPTPIPTPTPQKVDDAAKQAKKNALLAPTPAPEANETPFFKTPMGAALIVVVLLLVIGLASLALRLVNKPEERED